MAAETDERLDALEQAVGAVVRAVDARAPNTGALCRDKIRALSDWASYADRDGQRAVYDRILELCAPLHP